MSKPQPIYPSPMRNAPPENFGITEPGYRPRHWRRWLRRLIGR